MDVRKQIWSRILVKLVKQNLLCVAGKDLLFVGVGGTMSMLTNALLVNSC